MIHKFAMLLIILFGILALFNKGKGIKKLHYIVALVFVVSLFFYLFETSFSHLGYVIYGILLLLVFFSPTFVKNKGKILIHIGLFVISLCCLVIVHII